MKFWMDSAGWLGATLFLVSYALLVAGKWKPDQKRYHLANLFGAVLVCLNTWYDSSFPSVFVNGIWGMIAVYGMLHDKLSRKAPGSNGIK
ncbi:CBU_0592 family membrane protein [Algoriphagus sp.]|uniref:CBU_0592 family membrane protein n=1 Tax=Algoriphagus sp. TaxID=1872435 RepID=UPI003F6F3050